MASRSRSGSRSLKSSSSKAMKFFSGNSLLTNLAIFITIAVSISYLAKQHFYALIMLYGVAAIIFLISKNVLMSLALAIILTNLFAPPPVKRVKFFREGMENENSNFNKDRAIIDLNEIKTKVQADAPTGPKKTETIDHIDRIVKNLEGPNGNARFKGEFLKDLTNPDYENNNSGKGLKQLLPSPGEKPELKKAYDKIDNMIEKVKKIQPNSNQQGFTESMNPRMRQEAPPSLRPNKK